MKLRTFLAAGLCLLAAGAATSRAADATALYDRIADTYMMGKFEDLDKALAEAAKRMGDFTPEQKADVLYVREALAECRPAWWAACKQGKRVRIRQPILGRRFEAFYDPKGKGGVNMNTSLGAKRITVSWEPEEMDSTDKGMYGYLPWAIRSAPTSGPIWPWDSSTPSCRSMRSATCPSVTTYG